MLVYFLNISKESFHLNLTKITARNGVAEKIAIEFYVRKRFSENRFPL